MKVLGNGVELHRTETINNNLNPQWRPFSIMVADPNMPLTLEVWDNGIFCLLVGL
jgi:hypothetical protein